MLTKAAGRGGTTRSESCGRGKFYEYIRRIHGTADYRNTDRSNFELCETS